VDVIGLVRIIFRDIRNFEDARCVRGTINNRDFVDINS
jgi:hypothetical protein